jgi:ParB family transcriptional regulator, chromosome partitioning protein
MKLNFFSVNEVQDQKVIKEVDVEKILVNPSQPRRHFSQEELEELALSIKTVGLIHPPLVRPSELENFFELISGERRFRAAQLAGLTKILVVVQDATREVSAQAALIENIQRVDLNPVEIAKALRSLIDQFGYQHEELALRIGKKRSTVANYLRLLSLPRNIQESVSSTQITMGHAKAILSLDGFEKQNLLHELILRDDLTVREAEESALRISQKVKKQALPYINRDFHLEQLAEKLQQKLGTKVLIQGRGKKGRIFIDYYSLDDLERLLSLFELNES